MTGYEDAGNHCGSACINWDTRRDYWFKKRPHLVVEDI